MQRQMDMINEMFPFISESSQFFSDLYGSGGFGDLERYLTQPISLTNLDLMAPGFFGLDLGSGGRQLLRALDPEGERFSWEQLHGGGEIIPEGMEKWWGKGPEMLEEYIGNVESLFPAAREMFDEDWRADTEAARKYADWYLSDQAVPAIAERFGSSIWGSGAQAALANAGRELAAELGLTEIAADEASLNRQLQARLSGLPLATSLFQEPLNAATGFTLAGTQVGQNLRGQAEMTRPGARLAQMLPIAANIAASQGFMQQGFPTGGSSNELAALGQMFGGGGSMGDLAGGIGSIVNAWRNRTQTGDIQSYPAAAYTGLPGQGAAYPGSVWDQGPAPAYTYTTATSGPSNVFTTGSGTP